MATYRHNADVSGWGGGGDVLIPPDGGDGEDQSPGSNSPDYGARLRRARLGLLCGIATMSAAFLSLTSVYLVRGGARIDSTTITPVHAWGQVPLPWGLLSFNTALLVISSGTMEKARRSIVLKAALAPLKSIPGIACNDRVNFPWLGLTALLGFAFLAGQGMAWRALKARGFFIDTNPNAAFVYLLTAAHALHLAGGMVALGWASMASILQRPIQARRIVVDITGWYWHFIAVLWIYVFGLLEIAR